MASDQIDHSTVVPFTVTDLRALTTMVVRTELRSQLQSRAKVPESYIRCAAHSSDPSIYASHVHDHHPSITYLTMHNTEDTADIKVTSPVNTWPRWPPQLVHVISVRVLPNELST